MRSLPSRPQFSRPILLDRPELRQVEARWLKFIAEELAFHTRCLEEWIMPAIDDLRQEMAALVNEANLTREQAAATGAVLDKLHSLVLGISQSNDLSDVQAQAQEALGIFAQARSDLNARTTADDVADTPPAPTPPADAGSTPPADAGTGGSGTPGA